MELSTRGRTNGFPTDEQEGAVTGSTARIGFAVASLLAQEGASVVVNGRSQERVDAAVASIRQKARSAEVVGVAADLATKAGADLLTSSVTTVDILVNNLGIYQTKPFAEITDEDWLRLFEVNVLSGVRLSRFYLPQMLEQNWGRIVFISSESGLNIPVEMIHYGVTKTAQIALARGLAETTVGTGVTVNSVLPGPTRSEGVEQFVEGLAKTQGTDAASVEQEFFRSVPLLVAEAVCDPRGSGVDGGLRVQPPGFGHQRGGCGWTAVWSAPSCEDIMPDQSNSATTAQGQPPEGWGKKCPAFLFDLDGTLVDSVYQHVLAWREALEASGIELSVRRIHRRIGMSGGLLVNALFRETGRPFSADEAAKVQRLHAEFYAQRSGQVRPLPGDGNS